MARAISERCRDTLDMKGRPIKWGDVLGACFWDVETGGKPNKAFVKQRPVLITPQGQNRAAIMASVFSDKFGLAKSRGGRYGGLELFDGNEAAERFAELKKSLSESGAILPATVINFLSYNDARTKGQGSHTHEAGSVVRS
ncbi:unnamed protein product [Sphacelaria rigidula]